MFQFRYLKNHFVQISLLAALVLVFVCSACSISITDGKHDTPDAYDFVAVEKEPYIDMKLLQATIIYPPEAKRLGIEGKVNIRVLIGKNGIPQKYIIESADSPLLISEVVRAVMNATFSPATYNNQPIDCWVSVSIIFRL